jgi:Uma2 family endonuclease
MVLALPSDGNRYELLDGELLVSPAPNPRHQAVIGALFPELRTYLGRTRVGRVWLSPADLPLEGGQVAQPDIFVMPAGSVGPAPQTWDEFGIPMLVVEVLSPGTARYDRLVKRRRYQRTGVAEYWIVDPDARIIERWRPGDERPEIADSTLVWQPDPGREALVLDLADLF